eukprot:2402464-Prymnesium_polylepis.1
MSQDAEDTAISAGVRAPVRVASDAEPDTEAMDSSEALLSVAEALRALGEVRVSGRHLERCRAFFHFPAM